MTQPRILALDTTTEGCSAALMLAGEVTSRFERTPRGHTQRILPMVDQLLAEAELSLTALDAIAFNRGPGSFTGLRITVGVAQGLGFSVGLPLIPVSSLATLAMAQWRCSGISRVISAIDARMGEVYWGAYEISSLGEIAEVASERVSAAGDLPRLSGIWCGVGSGWREYGEILCQRYQVSNTDPTALPEAAEVVRIAQHSWQQGEVIDAADARPVYLRNQVVQVQRDIPSPSDYAPSPSGRGLG